MKDDAKVTKPLGRTIAVRISVIMLVFTLISAIADFTIAFNVRKDRLEAQREHFIDRVSPTIRESLWSLNNEILDVILLSITTLEGVDAAWLEGDGIDIKAPDKAELSTMHCDKVLIRDYKINNSLASRSVNGTIKICYNEPKFTFSEFKDIAGGVLPRLLVILFVSLVTFLLIRHMVVKRLRNTISVLRTEEDFRFDPEDLEKEMNSLDEIDVLEIELSNSTSRLNSANERINQKIKMEAVGTLTGAVSHEFNNLLAVISGGLELASSSNKNEKVEEYLQWTKEGVVNATDIATQLLSMTNSTDTHLQSISLNEFEEDIEKSIEYFSNDNVQISIEMQATGKIVTSRARLMGAILNLLKNSIEASQDTNGRVFLIIRDAAVEDVALFDGEPDFDYLLFQVVDNAGGIPLELRDKLFNPFFSTKTSGRGTGLGLWSVYNFAKISGGLAFYNPLPNGSCFKFILPRIMDMDVTYRQFGFSELNADIDDLKIMIIEDEPGLMLIYQEYFEPYAADLVMATNVKDGLSLLEVNDGFDAIICDYKLPDGLGTQIIKRASEIHPDTLKLIVSGNPDVQKGINLGADEVFKKPVELELILDYIKRHIRPHV